MYLNYIHENIQHTRWGGKMTILWVSAHNASSKLVLPHGTVLSIAALSMQLTSVNIVLKTGGTANLHKTRKNE
jgi:hypothetical protein